MGACGFMPAWNPYLKLLPIFLIKVDEKGNPIKDKNDFCIPCKGGEKGVIVGVIGEKTLNQFNGYANNKDASDKKIIENLFKKGQRAFNSGKMKV
jgi:solute carrier family 27 fatty acid transporter 1/4